MKTTFLSAVLVLAAVLLVSATIWEGVSDVAAPGDLPRSYSVATNSFPRNSVVDITNLENGKKVRVIVIDNLESTGLLATLSRSAADVIELRHDSTCRIWMTQPSDTGASPFYQLGPITGSGAAAAGGSIEAEDVSAVNTNTANSQPIANNITTLSIVPVEEPEAAEKDIIAADEPATPYNVIAVSDNIIATDEPAVTDNVVAASDHAVKNTEPKPEPRIASGTLSLIPAEERVPIAPEQSSIPSENVLPRDIESRNVAPKEVQPSVKQITETPVAVSPPAEFSPFQAPLISKLEQGKWYVQLGVYTHPDNVEDEIGRIGTAYPVAIQNIGTDTNPQFRILLGPLNQGESGAMLQRIKSIGYADAFIRNN